uniref:H15 domain-containing protein n=2 Tax=Panagrellus redivivus TaxID=6233 RepID=A0A7E4VM68_PANRE
MSLDRVAMALDDVIKEDRKANKGKGKKGANKAANNNNTKKAAGGIKKKNTPRKPKAAPGQDPATANLVKKLVKKALVQNGVVAKAKPVQRGARAQKKNNNTPQTTVVRKIVRKVVTGGAPSPRGRTTRRVVRRVEKPLGVSQRSRTIVRRVVQAPPRRQPQQTIVREVRYVRDPAPRRNERVVVRRAAPKPRQRVVVVDESPRARYGSVYSNSSSRRPARRSNDPFYEPRNYLQRY